MSDVLEASRGQIKVRASDTDIKNNTGDSALSVSCTFLLHAGV